MENNETKKEPLILKIFFVVFWAYIIFGVAFDIIFVSIYGNYLIGSTTEMVKGGYRGKKMAYEFKYNNKLYNHKSTLYKKLKTNHRYLIKFSPLLPSFNQLEVNYPVPDSIKMEDVPAEGWKEKPSWAVWTPAD